MNSLDKLRARVGIRPKTAAEKRADAMRGWRPDGSRVVAQAMYIPGLTHPRPERRAPDIRTLPPADRSRSQMTTVQKVAVVKAGRSFDEWPD